MTPERDATVESVWPQHIRLRLDDGCHGCSGCRGRCSLLGALAPDGDRLDFPLHDVDGPISAGQRVRIRLHESALLRQAWHGYGLPLLGLVSSALAAHLLAGWLNIAQDLPAALAAGAGTLAGVGLSKRRMSPSLRVAACPPADGIPLISASHFRTSNEDRTP